ncbi:hypothetical protein ON010_g2319 [Phytophthora cinnamomi]|nr:hypothetical protein ON010_g2319 [Phytophthora cinnamomi]
MHVAERARAGCQQLAEYESSSNSPMANRRRGPGFENLLEREISPPTVLERQRASASLLRSSAAPSFRHNAKVIPSRLVCGKKLHSRTADHRSSNCASPRNPHNASQHVLQREVARHATRRTGPTARKNPRRQPNWKTTRREPM